MFQKLLIITLGLFLVIAAGSCNIYPLYLANLKDRFNYSLKELNLYGAFINIGNWVGITTGLLYDKIGPRFCCLISAIILPSSYVLLTVLLNSSFESFHIIFLLLLGFIMGQSCSLIYTCSLNTNLKNFSSKHSTAIVGLITSNVAISPSIFTTFKEAMPNMKNSSFFIFVSIYLVIVIAFCAWLFKILPNPYPEHRKLIAYQNYKETKIIDIMTGLNLIILCVYLIGVVVNKIKGRTAFPNVIIYPLLQSLNFVILIVEKYEWWDKLLFNRFIHADIRRKERYDDINQLRRECEQEVKLPKLDKETTNDKEKDNEGEMKQEEQVVKEEEKIEEKPKRLSEKNVVNQGRYAYRGDSISDIKENTKTEPSTKSKRSFNRSMSQSDISKHNLDDDNDLSIEVHDGKKEKGHNKTMRHDHSPIIELNTLKALNKPHNHDKGQDQSLIEDQPNDNHINNNSNDKEKTILNPNASFHNNLNILNENDEVDRHNPISSIVIPTIPPTTAVQQLTFKQKITNPELIALFVILLLSVGSAISNLNNIQFIITSISSSSTTSEVFQYAILYFAFNSFARIFSGIILSKLIQYNRLFYFLIIVASIGFISQILGITLVKEAMYFSIATAGITHGGFVAFIPVYTRHTYHINDLGIIIGLLTTGSAFGSILIGTCIFSTFYEYNKDKELNVCYGAKCFRPAYIITSVFLLIALAMSSLLVYFNSKRGKRIQQRDVSLTSIQVK